MKAFELDGVNVSHCGGCPRVDCEDDDVEMGLIYFCTIVGKKGCYTLHEENKNGLTPSCPMYESSVEVEG